jgi:flagellar protein FlgJ
VSVDGIGKVGADAQGGLSSLDMAAISTRVDAARAADQEQQVTQAAAKAATAATGEVSPKELARLKAVSQDFESLFLGYMMKTMRNSVPKGGLWGQSQGEQIFTEMRDDELAKGLAKAGGIGLARLLEDQLKQTLQMQAQGAAKAAALAAEKERNG